MRAWRMSPSAWKDPRFVQVWGPRGAVHLVPNHDMAVFTLGRTAFSLRTHSGQGVEMPGRREGTEPLIGRAPSEGWAVSRVSRSPWIAST
jgi:hypothetical protein